jgi:hypothetical protein
MRGSFQAALLLPLALGNALPYEGTQFDKRSFDRVDDILAGLGSIKQDLMAGGAAINQQLYQAVQQPAQYKKCNPTNIQVRQEWYVSSAVRLFSPHADSIEGLPSPRPKRRHTSAQSSV